MLNKYEGLIPTDASNCVHPSLFLLVSVWSSGLRLHNNNRNLSPYIYMLCTLSVCLECAACASRRNPVHLDVNLPGGRESALQPAVKLSFQHKPHTESLLPPSLSLSPSTLSPPSPFSHPSLSPPCCPGDVTCLRRRNRMPRPYLTASCCKRVCVCMCVRVCVCVCARGCVCVFV